MPNGFPVGRLTRVVDWAGEHLHSYDNRGRGTDERHVIQSATYNVGHAFDTADRETCTVYPDGEKVGSTFDSQGVIETLKQYPGTGCAGTATATYLSSTNYSEAGMPTTLVYGNGLNVGYGYRSTDWRLTSITASTLLNYTYGYDAKGNVNSIGDTVEGTTQSLVYDARERLAQVTGLAQAMNYSYNEIGNTTAKQEGTSNYTPMTYPSPGTPRPHAISQANYLGGYHTFQYDANGNMTAELDNFTNTVHHYEYNQEGMTFYRVSGGEDPSPVFYYYDANGALVRKVPYNSNNPGIRYIDGIYEDDADHGEITKYYFAAGQRIAMRKAGILSFLTPDHLGSTSLVTDSSGAFAGSKRYYPYGRDRATQGTVSTDKLFTGQQRESTNGVYHYNARMYNADIGRMPQADAIVPERDNPQAYNAYSYVANNPANLIDPTGRGYVSGNCGTSYIYANNVSWAHGYASIYFGVSSYWWWGPMNYLRWRVAWINYTGWWRDSYSDYETWWWPWQYKFSWSKNLTVRTGTGKIQVGLSGYALIASGGWCSINNPTDWTYIW